MNVGIGCFPHAVRKVNFHPLYVPLLCCASLSCNPGKLFGSSFEHVSTLTICMNSATGSQEASSPAIQGGSPDLVVHCSC